MTHKSIPDWHRFVYRKNYGKRKVTDEWQKVKAACLKRDKNTCKRCDKKGDKYERPITAHHILPRSDGGEDYLENLISLCDPCHDYVEIHELRTRVDIIGSYEDEVNLHLEMSEESDSGLREESFIRPEWHKWVYGGQKRSRRA
jgi:hypothetical protein